MSALAPMIDTFGPTSDDHPLCAVCENIIAPEAPTLTHGTSQCCFRAVHWTCYAHWYVRQLLEAHELTCPSCNEQVDEVSAPTIRYAIVQDENILLQQVESLTGNTSLANRYVGVISTKDFLQKCLRWTSQVEIEDSLDLIFGIAS
jgi:hypothetical protein